MLKYADQAVRIVVNADTKGAEGKLASFKSKLGSLAKIGAVAGIAATAAAVTGSIKVFSDFEQAMANVKSVTFATEEEFQKLKDLAMSDEVTKLGYSAKEAADAMYYLGSAGYDAEQAGEALSGVLKLAAATQSDLALVSEKTAAAITMFGLEAGDADMVADKFAYTIANSQATMDKLADSMTYAGPMFSQLGYGLDDMLAALGGLYNLGIPASQAGTALRQSLAALASPTGTATAALEKYGLTVDDISPDMNTFGEILATLGSAGMDTAEMIDVLGIRGLSTGKMAEDAGASFEAFKSGLESCGGTAQTMADVQMDTLNGSFKILKETVKNTGIELGDFIVNKLDLSSRIKGISSWISTLKKSLNRSMETGDFTILGDMLGGSLLALPTEMLETFKSIDFRGAFSTIYEVFEGAVASLTEWLMAMDWEGIGGNIFNALAGIGEFVYNVIFNTDWAGVFKGVWNAIEGIGQGFFDEIRNVDWSDVWDTLTGTFSGIQENLSDFINETDWSETFANLTGQVAEAFGDISSEEIGAALDKAIDGIRLTLDMSADFLEWINTNLDKANGYIRSGEIQNTLDRIAKSIGDGITFTELTGEGENPFFDLITGLLKQAALLDYNINSISVGIRRAVIDFQFNLPSEIMRAIGEKLFGEKGGQVLGTMFDVITIPARLTLEVPLVASQKALDLIKWIIDGGWKDPKEAIVSIGSSISSWFSGVLDWIRGAGSAIKKVFVNISWPTPPSWFTKLMGGDFSIDFSWSNVKDFLPFMASGGIVTKPTLAMIGEAGPEAIVPLSQYDRGSGGNDNIEIHTTINVNGKMDRHEIDSMASYIEERITAVTKRRKGVYFGC